MLWTEVAACPAVKKRLVGRQINVTGDPLERGKIGLVEGAADTERPDGASRAAAETGAN
jgi:ssDNA-binding replication factor A large subunit